jgi:hypothetical protein
MSCRSISSDSADFSLELLFRNGLVDSDVFVCSNRNISIGVEFDWSLNVNLSLSFLLFIFSQLNHKTILTHYEACPWLASTTLLVGKYSDLTV